MKPSPRVLHQELSGESVLLDLRTEQYFGLDAIGTRVWQALHSGQDLDALADELVGQYEVSRERVRADIGLLVQQLLDAGLVLRE